MTIQVSESLGYDGQSFEIQGFSDVAPFHSLDIELNPVSASSACWRGYSCDYEIKNYRLYLEYLFVNHSDDNKTPSKEPPQPINEVQAIISDCPHIGKWQYSKLNLLCQDYSSGILIARGLNYDGGQVQIRHLWDYETVYELIFTHGVLLDVYSMDDTITEFREREKNTPAGKSYEEKRQWKSDNQEWFWQSFKHDYFS